MAKKKEKEAVPPKASKVYEVEYETNEGSYEYCELYADRVTIQDDCEVSFVTEEKGQDSFVAWFKKAKSVILKGFKK